MVGRERIDYSARRAMMPEETSGDASSFVTIGDVRLEGAAKRMGIPSRGDYEEYAGADA